MPKFAPNTGFKMPGVGSRNIDSPGNFRDEQHVDKMGYCDTTEDRMLPEGSSPLKARYTTTGYRKDIKELDLPQGAPAKEDEVYEKTETIDNGKEPVEENKSSSDRVSYGMDTTADKTVLGSEQAGTGNSYIDSFSGLKKGDDGGALAQGGFGGGDLKDWTTYVKGYNANKNATTVAGTSSYWSQKNKELRKTITEKEYNELEQQRKDQEA